jgi:thiamine pyrophosphate-dependent acetolactate synthase large subunit-like protein
VIVLNNRSLGWIRWYRRVTFGRGWQDDDFADVAFAEVARGFGWPAARVSEPGQLAGALRGALAGPAALLDVVTDTWQTPVTAHRRAIGAEPAQPAGSASPGGRPRGSPPRYGG